MRRPRAFSRDTVRPGVRRAFIVAAAVALVAAVIGAVIPANGIEPSQPHVGAVLGTRLIFSDWPAGAAVHVVIDDDMNVENGSVAAGDVVLAETWQEVDSLGAIELAGLITPGRYVTAGSQETTKTLRVQSLTVAGANPTSNVVSGTAEPGAELSVQVFSDQDESWFRQATADSAGAWSADLTGVKDLAEGDEGCVMMVEGDDDWTQVDWRIPKPRIVVTPTGNVVELVDWPAGSTVHVTLDADDNSTNGVAYSEDVVLLADGANGCDTNGIVTAGGVHAGQFITATQGARTQRVRVVPVSVTRASTSANSIGGSASPGVRVKAWVENKGANDVTATVAGAWGVTFWGVDVVAGDHGGAAVEDDDGDEVRAYWTATSVSLKASASRIRRGKSFVLSGSGKPAAIAGGSVSIEVKKPGKGWAKLATRTVPASGSWTYRYTAARSATTGTYSFRAVYARHGALMGSTSSTAKVVVVR